MSEVTLEIKENGIAIVRMGEANEHVVILDKKRMDSLKEVMTTLTNTPPKGVVFLAANQEMFTAGADIQAIMNVTEPDVGTTLARQGQALFAMIEDLPCPTIAAISGTCVGGGCELVLACDYRIITDNSRSLIGLPEVKLGILPGFGGTQRLPRLIGLQKALDIILAGKTLRAKKAKAYGLVDSITSWSELEKTAVAIVSGNKKLAKQKIPFIASLLTHNSFLRSFIEKKASQLLAKRTKGFYPAPPAALKSVIYGLENGTSVGYDFEAKELGRLIVSPESKSLVHIFFLTESAKSLGKPARKEVKDTYAAVIGAGTMGAGIAGLLSKNECSVILKDRTQQDLTRGISYVKNDLSKLSYLSESEKSFIVNRIEPITESSGNLSNVNLVIEAVFEKLELKQEILSSIAQSVKPDAIIASNTSSLSLTQIASAVPNPSRVVGMHFFNPVAKMPLVEIIRANQTDPRTVIMVAAIASMMGKFPIVVEDVPGFLVNRILSPYLNEAGYLLKDGYSIKDIDKAAISFGLPMGPVRLLDEIGLDVAAHVSDQMFTGYGERMKSVSLVKQLVQAGRLGKKSGAGFYTFSDKNDRRGSIDETVYQTLGLPKPGQSNDRKEILDRLTLSLINESIRCLDEGVAGAPGKEAADQIDLGSVMGFGFPPFRGGILYYANSLGMPQIYESLTKLHEKYGARFEPADGIKQRAAKS